MAMREKTRIATAPLHATLPAGDLARAERFYGETLGMDIQRDPSGGGFMTHAGAGCWMYVYETEAGGGSATQAVFTVESVEDAVMDLRDHGIQFEEYDQPGLKTVDGIAQSGGMKSAWFKDSEGNTLAISEDPRKA